MQTRAWLLFLALPSLIAARETVCALGPGVSSYKPASDQRPAPDAMQIAGRVNAAVKPICGQNCPTMALFRNATSPNIMLLNDAGQAKIVYSPQFFATAYDRYGDLGILALIAHELGHALDATLGAKWVNEKWTPELRGDAWAGCILAHVDPGVGGYTPSLEALASYPSSAHPDWSQRLPVVRAGFAGCGGDAAKLQKK